MKFPDLGGGNGGGKQGGVFIKMEDGDRIKGVFRGDPHIFRQHWIQGRAYVCTNKGCEHCAVKDKPKFRFRINFITQDDDGIWIAKIFEQSYGVYLDLKGLHEDDYDLEQTLVSVVRTGKQQDTRYQILPARQNLTAAEFKKVAAIPLNELGEKGAEDASSDDGEEGPGL